jgi:hypothetical protein
VDREARRLRRDRARGDLLLRLRDEPGRLVEPGRADARGRLRLGELDPCALARRPLLEAARLGLLRAADRVGRMHERAVLAREAQVGLGLVAP